jgi:hypothetical protein
MALAQPLAVLVAAETCGAQGPAAALALSSRTSNNAFTSKSALIGRSREYATTKEVSRVEEEAYDEVQA